MSIQDHRVVFLVFGTILLVVPNSAFEIIEPSDEVKWNDAAQTQGLKTNNNEIEQNEFLRNENDQAGAHINDVYKNHEENNSVLQKRAFNPFNLFSHHSTSYSGNYLNIDQNGVHIEVINPRNSQLITVRGRKVFLNYRVICRDTRKLSAEPKYQKTRDGSMWYTNLRVGTEMTPAEIEEFKKLLEENRTQAEEVKNHALAAAQQAVKQGEAAAKMGQEIGHNAIAAAQEAVKQGETAAKMGQEIGRSAISAAEEAVKQGGATAKMGQEIGQSAISPADEAVKQGGTAAKMGQEIGQSAISAAQEAVKQGETAAKMGQDIGQSAMDTGRKITEDALEMTRNIGKSFGWWW